MPTYHYACSSCRNEFDQYQSFTEDTLSECPSCEGFIRRVIQPVGIVFKGTGWYLTDSRKPEKSENGVAATTDGSVDSATDKPDPKAAKSDASSDSKSDSAKTGTTDKKSDPAPAKKSAESKPAPITAS